MNTRFAVLLLALAAAFSSTVRATPLEQLRDAQVSKLEFGSFKLEVALIGIKDWPFPVEGASVSYKFDPEQIEIVVAVRKVPASRFALPVPEPLDGSASFSMWMLTGLRPWDGLTWVLIFGDRGVVAHERPLYARWTPLPWYGLTSSEAGVAKPRL